MRGCDCGSETNIPWVGRDRRNLAAHRLIATLAMIVAVTGSARALEDLPVIVTYEMQKAREVARIERRDPKGFWVRQIMARLEDRKPDTGLGLAEAATARVAFTVARDGRIVSKAIQQSSGTPAVDKAALAMLDRAAPFPPMPATVPDAELTFALPLKFH